MFNLTLVLKIVRITNPIENKKIVFNVSIEYEPERPSLILSNKYPVGRYLSTTLTLSGKKTEGKNAPDINSHPITKINSSNIELNLFFIKLLNKTIMAEQHRHINIPLISSGAGVKSLILSILYNINEVVVKITEKIKYIVMNIENILTEVCVMAPIPY